MVHFADDFGASLLLLLLICHLALFFILFEPGISLAYHPLHLVKELAHECPASELIDKDFKNREYLCKLADSLCETHVLGVCGFEPP